MPEPKTRPTSVDPSSYINKLSDVGRREDCVQLVKLFQGVVRADPVMWGSDIVGFGSYTMKYADGREMDWPLTGFSPRKTALVLYVPGLRNFGPQVKKLGKCKASGGCLHVKRLEDVDLERLKDLVAASVKAKKAKA